MTGEHIRKESSGEWKYPNHQILEQKCALFPIATYIKRRRGTLWKYFLEFRKELIEETKGATVPAKNVNKVLWWKQPYITKQEMVDLKNFWFK